MYPHNITDILPLHVAHLPLLTSLFTVGLCMPKGSLQYFPTVVHKEFKYPQPASYSFKATKELYALRLRHFYYRLKSFTYMYLECSHHKLNRDNIIEALIMAIIA